uniref:NID domain-containing protein n=2 Tax=Pyxicephalus adspersus TaxID=30357 RepID=A0AAV3ACV6_PYXAD|nr:TPA: hypothetical protein GDO54_015516 [Pyxicephalus adspersus]
MKRDDLEEDEAEIKKKLSENEKVFRKFQDTLMIKSQLPQKNLNFKGINSAENADDEPMDIAYTCHIIASEPFVLEGGQALLTFENEQVAKSVIAKRKHPLDINDKKVFVEVQEPPLGKSVKFEVNMNISNKKLKVSNLPQDLPEETIKDKVELTFYKSGIGGGEIKNVDYDRNNNTAYVTYLQNGVAQRVLKENSYQLMAGKDTHEVEVEPCMYIELNKLQMFSSVSSRSVLITGIKNVDDEEEEDVKDLIELHFQKESNGGGEVESIAFSQDRKIKPIFEEDLK